HGHIGHTGRLVRDGRCSSMVRHYAAGNERRFTFFCFSLPTPTEIYTLSLHDALPILPFFKRMESYAGEGDDGFRGREGPLRKPRSEEHTFELQSRRDLVCRLLLEKKKKN